MTRDKKTAIDHGHTEDYYCAQRDKQGNVRMNCGRGALVASATDTVDVVRAWFDRSIPGPFREQYRSVLRLMLDEAYEETNISKPPASEDGHSSQSNLRTVEAYLAKTLDNIEGDEEPWPAKDVREFITDALAFAASGDPAPAETESAVGKSITQEDSTGHSEDRNSPLASRPSPRVTTSCSVADVMAEPIVRQSSFGPYLDFDFRDATGRPARTIIVGARINGDFQPRRILLPHQLYIDSIERMKADGATEIRVHPIYDQGFTAAWALAEHEGERPNEQALLGALSGSDGLVADPSGDGSFSGGVLDEIELVVGEPEVDSVGSGVAGGGSATGSLLGHGPHISVKPELVDKWYLVLYDKAMTSTPDAASALSSETTFAEIENDYVEAQAAYETAKARYDAAGLVLVRAQCREVIALRLNVRHDCVLERGHAGDHWNAKSGISKTGERP